MAKRIRKNEMSAKHSRFTTIRFDAGHDTNGNPRRVFVVLEGGDIVTTYKEEYNSVKAIKNPFHRRAYNGLTFETTTAEYRALVKAYE